MTRAREAPAGRSPLPAPGRIACCVGAGGDATALAEGGRLARLTGARLQAVHAAPGPRDVEPERLAQGWPEGLPRDEPVIIPDRGHPAAAVSAWAEREGVDVLVAAPHQGALARLLLGSFASHLAQHAPCDVLVARPTAQRDGDRSRTPSPRRTAREPARPFRRIACCLDDSPAARHSLAVAAGLRDLAGGALVAVHAVGSPAAGESASEARRLLDEAAAETGADPVLVYGTPAMAIARWAAEQEVGLLVAASHRGAMSRVALGSFAGRLAHHAPCSLLLTRSFPGGAGG